MRVSVAAYFIDTQPEAVQLARPHLHPYPSVQQAIAVCHWIVQVVLRPEQTKGFVLLKKRSCR